MRFTYRERSMAVFDDSRGEFVPVYEIISAERRTDEAWVRFRATLSNQPDRVIEIVFHIDGNEYKGVRLFSGLDLSTNPESQKALTWTRCSV